MLDWRHLQKLDGSTYTANGPTSIFSTQCKKTVQFTSI